MAPSRAFLLPSSLGFRSIDSQSLTLSDLLVLLQDDPDRLRKELLELGPGGVPSSWAQAHRRRPPHPPPR